MKTTMKETNKAISELSTFKNNQCHNENDIVNLNEIVNKEINKYLAKLETINFFYSNIEMFNEVKEMRLEFYKLKDEKENMERTARLEFWESCVYNKYIVNFLSERQIDDILSNIIVRFDYNKNNIIEPNASIALNMCQYILDSKNHIIVSNMVKTCENLEYKSGSTISLKFKSKSLSLYDKTKIEQLFAYIYNHNTNNHIEDKKRLDMILSDLGQCLLFSKSQDKKEIDKDLSYKINKTSLTLNLSKELKERFNKDINIAKCLISAPVFRLNN